jgi:hypothetical protein
LLCSPTANGEPHLKAGLLPAQSGASRILSASSGTGWRKERRQMTPSLDFTASATATKPPSCWPEVRTRGWAGPKPCGRSAAGHPDRSGWQYNCRNRGSFTHVHKSGHMSRMNSSKSSNEDRRGVHIVGSPAETCLYTSCVQTRSDASNYLTKKTRHYSTRDSRGTIAVRHITVPPSARRRHNFSAQGVVLNENR